MMVLTVKDLGGGVCTSAPVLCEERVRADMSEAADEIERLNAQLADMKGYFGPIPNRSGPAFQEVKQ
jgi:hypothetical protein